MYLNTFIDFYQYELNGPAKVHEGKRYVSSRPSFLVEQWPFHAETARDSRRTRPVRGLFRNELTLQEGRVQSRSQRNENI